MTVRSFFLPEKHHLIPPNIHMYTIVDSVSANFDWFRLLTLTKIMQSAVLIIFKLSQIRGPVMALRPIC